MSYTKQEQQVLDSVSGAFGRLAAGGTLGVAGGAATHAVLGAYTALGTASYAIVDPLLNVFDLAGGTLLGLSLGMLWALNTALLRSGVIRDNIRGAIGALVEEEDDAAAGEKALETIRDGLATLARRGDLPLKLAFWASGLTEEPAVAKLVEEAQAAQEESGAGKTMSDIIALVFEATLEARLSDAAFLFTLLSLSFIGSTNTLVWLIGASFDALYTGGAFGR